MRIGYIDGPRLRRALIAGCEYAQTARAELNRINVFPVPDGDTGTNLALTVRSIMQKLHDLNAGSAAEVAAVAAEAGVLGARGNCGMILSHYLLGLAESMGQRARLSAVEFARALRGAVEHLTRALERPVEGTMLTVMRDVADGAEEETTREQNDFAELIESMLARARESLARTPELLPALKRAGVVDAGAKGFVALLEGVGRLIRGEPTTADPDGAAGPRDTAAPLAAGAVDFPGPAERYRFCTEVLVRGRSLPTEETVRAGLRELGDSLIVIRSGEVLKVHVHTDEPERVFAWLRATGEVVTHKAEDMSAQHAAVGRSSAAHVGLARRPVGVLTDSACDLPDEVIRAHGIQVVPLMLLFEEEVLRDRVEISSAEFEQRLVAGAHPTTSQPPPAEFVEGIRRAAEDAESIIAVLLGSTLSGTFASAEVAAKRLEGASVHMVDSLGASLLQGLLVLKAAELAERAMPPAEIVAELRRIRARSGILFTVESFERLIASGRLGRGAAWLGTMLGVRPILSLTQTGTVEVAARARIAAIQPRMLDLLRGRVPPGSAVRFGVIHVANARVVPEVSAALRATFGDVEILSSPATPVIATHIGPGAWGVAYIVE